jgi:hypothetical protein
MFDAPEEMPNAHMIPHVPLRAKYGDYFFTSSLAWMAAMAIEAILLSAHKGDVGPHSIGFWGVDMAANEEYGYQRAGCQYFAQIAEGLGIEVVIPKESDLMTPPPLYGLSERTHRGVKLTSRKAEIDNRLKMAETKKSMAEQEVSFLTGAKDDLDYHMKMWNFDGEPNKAKFAAIFALPQAPEEPSEE